MLVAAPTSPTADEPLQPLVPEDGPKVGRVSHLRMAAASHCVHSFPPCQQDEAETPLPLPSFQKASWPTEESVNVLVTHVVDPGHFYVQIIGKDSLEPLHTLQEDMT